MSLDQISARTGIRVAALRAIEAEDADRLPRGIILRGFLKQYAREVGLNPDDVAMRYLAQFELHGVGSSNTQPGRTNRLGLRESLASYAAAGRSGWWAGGAVVLLGLTVAGYLLTRQTPGTQPGVQSSEPAASAVESPAPPAARTTAPPVDASAETLRVDLHATGECWISAHVDGQQVAYRELAAGERLSFQVTEEAVIRIGRPANLAVSIDDAPLRPFERPATPVTLRITPANYRDLLQR